MSEFKILGEAEGLRSGDESVYFKEVHTVGVAGEQETTEQLGKNVEGYLYVGGGLDDAAGNAENGGED